MLMGSDAAEAVHVPHKSSGAKVGTYTLDTYIMMTLKFPCIIMYYIVIALEKAS